MYLAWNTTVYLILSLLLIKIGLNLHIDYSCLCKNTYLRPSSHTSDASSECIAQSWPWTPWKCQHLFIERLESFLKGTFKLFTGCRQQRTVTAKQDSNNFRWTWVSVSLQILLHSNDLLYVQSGHMFFVQQVDENNSQKKINRRKK